MFESFRRLLRPLIPRGLFPIYHAAMGWLSATLFGWPARKMVVIGVTGTDGKTTTATMIAQLLGADGAKVGLSSSVFTQIGGERRLNETHLTTPGEFPMQRMLSSMVKAGCRYVVLELSSEALARNRHVGLSIDIAVLTNLSPEHIASHGSFEAYRAAKGKLLTAVAGRTGKKLNGAAVPRAAVVNLDDEASRYFVSNVSVNWQGITMRQVKTSGVEPWDITNITTTADSSTFTIRGTQFHLPLPGRFNVANAAEAVTVATLCGVPLDRQVRALSQMTTIPGRQESIANHCGYRIIVDYALTPAALQTLYTSLNVAPAKLIAVFGAAGGGRDTWKRPKLGEIAAAAAERIILTVDDPYKESPADICADIRRGIPASYTGRVDVVLDRRLAIRRALDMVKNGETIALTGMGAETSMMIGDKAVPWNDAAVVREELARQDRCH